jgi:hypothetical protein
LTDIKNQNLVHEIPVHDVEVGVLSALIVRRIIDPLFYAGTFSSD